MIALLTLFGAFFTIGLFSFGGGLAIIPLLEFEALSRGWMEPHQIPDMLAITQAVPGAIAVNMAAFVGFRLYGFTGVLWAVLGIGLPSFTLVSVAVHFLKKVNNSRIVKGAFYGLRPAACGLIAAAAIRIAFAQFFGGIVVTDIARITWNDVSIISIMIFVAAFYCMYKKRVNPIWVVLGAAAIGVLLGYSGEI